MSKAKSYAFSAVFAFFALAIAWAAPALAIGPETPASTYEYACEHVIGSSAGALPGTIMKAYGVGRRVDNEEPEKQLGASDKEFYGPDKATAMVGTAMNVPWQPGGGVGQGEPHKIARGSPV